MDGTRVLITGGLGFVGSNLAHRLVELGAEVTLFDACLDPYGWNPANIEDIGGDLQFVKGDIRDYDLLVKHVTGTQLIFHLAAQVGRVLSMEEPHLDTAINCHGTLNLLEACRVHNPAAKIVYAGSRAQVGEPIYLPVDERHPDNPTDIYGINKLAAERYLLLYGSIYDMPVVSLRLNNAYGPRSQIQHGYYSIVSWFIGNILTGKNITVYGRGDQTRDYVYIDDVVDAFVRVAQASAVNGNVYLVGSGVETVFLDMVRTIIDVMGKGQYVHVPFPEDREKIDVKRFVVTYKRLQDAVGWKPTTSLREGLKKTVGFYDSHLASYLQKPVLE